MAASTPSLARRTDVILNPDRSRVLIRPFYPNTEINEQKAVKIMARILALPEPEVETVFAEVMAEFSERHQKIRDLFLERFESVRSLLVTDQPLSETRRLLIGSYFTHEYSLEAAALFNPSIVPHPDQSDLPEGSLRFILSLRATGEGHISSITFRTGVIDADHAIAINAPTRYLTEPRQIPNATYDKLLFEKRLHELGLANSFTQQLTPVLSDNFTLEELARKLAMVQEQTDNRGTETATTASAIMALARSNCEVQFTPDQRYSERVIFPFSPSQSNGIEDARFVLFTHEDGTHTYFATYTAYNGKVIFPQLVATRDFLRFRFITLNGPAAQNKGMALFPRKIDGRYCMLSRQDNENILLMFSDHLHFWESAEVIVRPTYSWEFQKMGNCGSPIETEAGWLVITHGVGPLRKYCMGALLLDRADPRKVIGRLREPLLTPNESEREGYVPNVVYSCGALVHAGQLVLPYAVSDYATRFALVSLADLIAAME